MSKFRPQPSWQLKKPNNIIVNDPLAVIYNEGQWKLSKVSPLYNLQYTPVKLKQYASKIRQSLVNTIKTNSNIKYTVLFEAQPNLKYSEDDCDALMITVTANQDTKSKIVYNALMLSWGVSIHLDGAVHLPYLIERGEQKLGSAVRTTLQSIFDCTIKQYLFSQNHLLQFGFNLIENDSSRSTDPFNLLYRTPQVDVKDKVKLKFEVGDINIIWNGVQEEVLKESNQIVAAYQMLQKQILYMTTLDVTAFELCEVSLARAEVKNSGMVKMKTPEAVNSVFTVLNNINNIILMDTSDVEEELVND